jgi:hypothetical protein
VRTKANGVPGAEPFLKSVYEAAGIEPLGDPTFSECQAEWDYEETTIIYLGIYS